MAPDYAVLIDRVRLLTGIDLGQYKPGQMERRVRTYATRQGAPSLAEYAERIKRDPEELDRFLDNVTINVSQLWRNPEQWELLKTTIYPELSAGGRKIRAWSAGASYGAEAYSLAALADVLKVPIAVTGTDIDPRVVERARRGRFTKDDARDAPAALLRTAFLKDGDDWQASDHVRRNVRFEVGDLLRVQPKRDAYDLVLCRNTVIYFTEPVRDALHERLATSLRPGGYLVVGATERVADPRRLGLEQAHPFTYRKAGA